MCGFTVLCAVKVDINVIIAFLTVPYFNLQMFLNYLLPAFVLFGSYS